MDKPSCAVCNEQGYSHCSQPEECGSMKYPDGTVFKRSEEEQNRLLKVLDSFGIDTSQANITISLSSTASGHLKQ